VDGLGANIGNTGRENSCRVKHLAAAHIPCSANLLRL